MKSKECKKHNHKLTNFLKVFIYMLVMLAPFFAIGVKCWYVASNKNANESYSGSYRYDANVTASSTEINTLYTGIDVNYIYNYSYGSYRKTASNPLKGSFSITTDENYMPSANGTNGGLYAPLLMNVSNVIINNTEYNDINSILFTYGALNGGARNGRYISLFDLDVTNTNISYTDGQQKDTIYQTTNDGRIAHNAIHTFNLADGNLNIRFSYIEDYIGLLFWSQSTTTSTITSMQFLYNVTYPAFIVDTTLSSVFYAAIDELDDASIFSWTTDTGVYTAINNMCVNLGIVSPPLAVLLTYWSLITAIYIIIDIVIESFTFLTHWFTDKMV